METKARRARHSRDPLPGRERIIATPTERDIEIFKLLDPNYRYAFLPSNWIHAFVGGNRIKLIQRLGHLHENPNRYLLRPHQQWRSPNSGYKHIVYARDANAEKVLEERGLLLKPHRRNPNHFAHELLNCLVDASIEYGVRNDPSLTLRGWDELQHGRPFWKDHAVPAETLRSRHPFRFKLAHGDLIPDGRPFVLENSRKLLCIAAKEIDRNTEPLPHDRYHHSTITRKFEHYRELFARKLYAKQYGFPNSVVLFVTVNETHMHNMMRLCEEIIGPCTYLLFKWVPDWAFERRFPEPNGSLLTDPWLRAGHPPFSLTTLGEIT